MLYISPLKKIRMWFREWGVTETEGDQAWGWAEKSGRENTDGGHLQKAAPQKNMVAVGGSLEHSLQFHEVITDVKKKICVIRPQQLQQKLKEERKVRQCTKGN